MTETSTENNANTKTSAKPEALNPTVEEDHFFHPVQLATGGNESPVVEVERKLEDLLKSITEETAQLSEFLTEECKLTSELCTSLTQVLKRLNITIDIPPQTIPLDRKVRKAVLNEGGELVVTLEGGEKKKAFLAEYPPDMVMTILWVVMPELVNAIKAYRKKLGMRVSFFVGLKKELKNIAKTIVEGDREGDAKPIQEQKPETKTEK